MSFHFLPSLNVLTFPTFFKCVLSFPTLHLPLFHSCILTRYTSSSSLLDFRSVFLLSFMISLVSSYILLLFLLPLLSFLPYFYSSSFLIFSTLLLYFFNFPSFNIYSFLILPYFYLFNAFLFNITIFLSSSPLRLQL